MILAAFKKVFSNMYYVVIAGAVAFIVFVLSVWLPNMGLVLQIITSSTASASDKLNILFGLLGAIKTNFSFFSALYTTTIAVLFGTNVAMLVYLLKQQRQSLQKSGAVVGLGGFISGIFGIGCAACGTLVLGPALSLVGVGGFISVLPFEGQEFGVLGVFMLSFATFLITKKI